jgi:hypothetical protein
VPFWSFQVYESFCRYHRLTFCEWRGFLTAQRNRSEPHFANVMSCQRVAIIQLLVRYAPKRFH